MSNFTTLWREESEHSSHSPSLESGAQLWNIWEMFCSKDADQIFKSAQILKICVGGFASVSARHFLHFPFSVCLLLSTCQNKRLAVLFSATTPQQTHTFTHVDVISSSQPLQLCPLARWRLITSNLSNPWYSANTQSAADKRKHCFYHLMHLSSVCVSIHLKGDILLMTSTTGFTADWLPLLNQT